MGLPKKNKSVNTRILASKISLVLAGFLFGFAVAFHLFPKPTRDEPKPSLPPTQAEIPKCPALADKNINPEYARTLSDKVQVGFTPQSLPQASVTFVKEKFEPKKLFGLGLLTTKYFDVDKDAIKENIISSDSTNSNVAQTTVVIKNGFIIFQIQGVSPQIEEVGDHDGFITNETLDLKTGSHKKTRYVYKDGAFIPVWFQSFCDVIPQTEVVSKP